MAFREFMRIPLQNDTDDHCLSEHSVIHPINFSLELDPDEFIYTVQLVSAALKSKVMPVKNISTMGFTLHDKGLDKDSHYVPKDIPINRAMILARDFLDDSDKFASFMMRFYALEAFLQVEDASEWIRTAENGDFEVAEAVYICAAKAPLGSESRFLVRELNEMIRSKAQELNALDLINDN